MGSKHSKKHGDNYNEKVVTEIKSSSSTTAKPIPVATTATNAGIITGGSSVPGVTTTIPSVPTMTTSPVYGTAVPTNIIPSNYNAAGSNYNN
jgi:hypothetical protein